MEVMVLNMCFFFILSSFRFILLPYSRISPSAHARVHHYLLFALQLYKLFLHCAVCVCVCSARGVCAG